MHVVGHLHCTRAGGRRRGGGERTLKAWEGLKGGLRRGTFKRGLKGSLRRDFKGGLRRGDLKFSKRASRDLPSL